MRHSRASLIAALPSSPPPSLSLHPSNYLMVLAALALFIFAALASDSPSCILPLPELGLTFNLSALGTLRVEGDWTYVVNVCGRAALTPRDHECEAPAVFGALAYQVHTGMAGECYALSDHGRKRAAGALRGGGVGVEVALTGGTECGAALRRAITVIVECGDGGVAPPAVEPVKDCLFLLRVRSPAGCPLECARDGAGAVCGGPARGACKLRDGGARCACVAGHDGPACSEPLGGGAEAAFFAPGPLLFFSFGAVVVAAVQLARRWGTREGGEGSSSSSSGSCGFPWWALGSALLLLMLLVALRSASGGGFSGIHAAITAPLRMGAFADGNEARLPTAALPPSPPLLLVYGDIEKYWGSYAVKHFIVTVNALKREKGWEEYVPSFDNPRDDWQVMEARMLREFGRLPDVMLMLQDHGLTGVDDALYESYHRSSFPNSTQILNWYDDTVRGRGASMAKGLRGVSVLLPTYEYLTHWRIPGVAAKPRVWTPHSALPAFFAQGLNPVPASQVLLVGATMDGYPLRMEVLSRIKRGDKRFVQWEHPGWTSGPSMQHIDDFAAAIARHLACILDGSANNFLVAKVFEVPATGSLLLMSDDVADALAAVGLRSGEHYLSFNRTSIDAIADWVLDPLNRGTVDRIRAAGRTAALAQHTTAQRVDAIHAVGLMAARVQRERGGVWDAASVKAVSPFPAYADWEWKDPASALYYSEKAAYRRAEILVEAEERHVRENPH